MSSILKVSEIQDAAGKKILQNTGSVLQVKNHTLDGGSQSTTSTSLVGSGLTLNITPTSSTSKFLILASMHEIFIADAQKAIGIAIARDGTRLHDTDAATLGYITGATNNYFNVNLQAYDSPSTTDTITYSVMVRSIYGSSVAWNGDNTPTFLTVMEISA